MQDTSQIAVSDDEYRLINALQISPWAPWSVPASVLGQDPVTLARHWARLERCGIAWIGAYLSGNAAKASALFELSCPPSQVLAVARSLAYDKEVLTIDLTTGARDLLLTVLCEDFQELQHYAVERMRLLPQVVSMRTQIVTSNRLTFDARTWRLNVLTPAEVRQLAQYQKSQNERGLAVQRKPDRRERDLIASALRHDPRMSMESLARYTGIPSQRARDCLSLSLTEGDIVLRAEIARILSQTPVYAWLFIKVAAGQVPKTLKSLAAMPETRLATAVMGSCDIALAAWLKSLKDLERLKTALAQQLGLSVVDTSIVMRTPVHLHEWLNEAGLRIRAGDAQPG
jgi:DNA-binding Lrp family transcriptional regulator